MKKTVDVAVIGAGTAGLNALSEIQKVTENLALKSNILQNPYKS